MSQDMKIKRFLIADPDEASRQSLKAILGELQLQDVTLVANGQEALDALDPKNIQFLIMRWELTPMTGVALAQRIRSMAAWRYLPILIITSKVKLEDLRLTKEIGIGNVLPFPIDRSLVASTLKEMIAKEEQFDATYHKLRQATGFMLDGSYGDALNLAKEAALDVKYQAQSQTIVGEVHLKKEEYDDSERVLNTVLKASSSHVPAKQLLAKVYSRTKRHAEAIKLLQQMAEYSPLNLSTLCNLGHAYIANDELDKAKETFQKAADQDPDSPAANVGLGTVAFAQGDYALAKEFLGESESNDEIVRSLNNIAIGKVMSDRFDEAISSYQAALQIVGADNKVAHILHYNLGLALKKKGDLGKALESLGASYLLESAFDKAFAAFAKVLRELRDTKTTYDETLVTRVAEARQVSRPEPKAA